MGMQIERSNLIEGCIVNQGQRYTPFEDDGSEGEDEAAVRVGVGVGASAFVKVHGPPSLQLIWRKSFPNG